MGGGGQWGEARRLCQEKVDGDQHDSECRHWAVRESLPVFPPCFVSRQGRCHGDLVFYRRPRRQGADDALTWPCLFIKKNPIGCTAACTC